MASKHSSLLEDQPAAASSSTEEEEEFESEEEEKVEEEPPAEAAEEPRDNESDSDDSDEVKDGSKSDSGDSTKKPSKQPPTVKPKKRTASKPTSSTRKRTFESENVEKEKDSKKKKKKKKEVGGDGVSEEGGKKMPAGQVWSEQDELILLNGMIGYIQRGISPSSIDHGELFDSIKSSIDCKVNQVQFSGKIRRLKSKYRVNVVKGIGGEDPIFTNPHDTETYQLMKLIWSEECKKVDNGNGGGKPQKPRLRTRGGGVSANRELVKLEEENLSMYPHLNDFIQSTKKSTRVSESILKEGMCLLGESTIKEFELKWRKLQFEELEWQLKYLELKREQIFEALNALKSSNI